MSTRPPRQPLRPSNWRTVQDLLRELAPELNLRVPDSVPEVPQTAKPAPRATFAAPALKLSPEPPMLAIATFNDDRRRYRIAARLFRLALRLLPAKPGPFPHARGDAELERLRQQMTDWAAWLEEADREAARLEGLTGPGEAS